MIETPAFAATPAGTTSRAPDPAPTANRSVLSSDFETFLKMLTAQARYQDPLEPLDSTEYAAQLAQFSMVEQQVRTNESLNALLGQIGGVNMAELAGLIGMEARAPGPARFDGSPLTVVPPADTSSTPVDRAELVITDSAGREVQRLPVPAGNDPMIWSGTGPDGQLLPVGDYSFTVEKFTGSSVSGTDPAEVYQTVSEARVRDGAVVVVFDGGRSVAVSAVSALRKPG